MQSQNYNILRTVGFLTLLSAVTRQICFASSLRSTNISNKTLGSGPFYKTGRPADGRPAMQLLGMDVLWQELFLALLCSMGCVIDCAKIQTIRSRASCKRSIEHPEGCGARTRTVYANNILVQRFVYMCLGCSKSSISGSLLGVSCC